MSQVGKAGNTGLAFLKMGIGGRSAALGGAVVAQSVDASAAYWNPAGLAGAANEAYFAHSEWLQDIRNEFLSFKFQGVGADLAIFLQLQNIGGILQRQKPTPEPAAEISAHDFAFGLSYAQQASANLQIGATLKYIGERIWNYVSNGAAIDVGIRFTPVSIRGLAIAASVHNLGVMQKFRNEPVSLPAFLRLGIAFQPRLLHHPGDIQFFAALRKVFSGDLIFGFGTEVLTRQKLAFRLGYQAGIETQSVSAGIGLLIGKYRLDYAYVPFELNLGDTHRISLAISL